MPTTIPFDPSLTLGGIVQHDRLDKLIEIAKLKAPIDAAMNDLNADIELRRSLDLTKQELINLKIDPYKLNEPIEEINRKILESAETVATRKIEAGPLINAIKSSMPVITKNIESPVDFNKSVIKQLPLSSDSIETNAQYFSFEENSQSSDSTISKIKSFVAASTSFLGTERSVQASSQAEKQVSQQLENHSLSGTLIITANCTHKDAVVLAPFVLDVDKGIRVWNEAIPDRKIKINDVSSMHEIAQEEGTDQEKRLNILSGATYGSSFVGMVHVLKTDSSKSSQKMVSTAAKLQAQMKTGNWFAKASGGFGVDASFASDVKNMLSSQEISSHISIVAMGCIPNIKSNDIQQGVQKLGGFNAKEMMEQLAILSNESSSTETIDASANAARTGAEMVAMSNSKVTSVMSGLAEIEYKNNKMLDINSLMTAFEDYVDKALAGNIGVPINFYLKSITRAQLAQMWVAKYYPGKFLAISGDDSTSSGGGEPEAEAE